MAAALEAELPKYQELANRRTLLSTLTDSIAAQRAKQTKQEQLQQEQIRLLNALKQESEALSHTGADQERLLREQEQLAARQTALQALAQDVQKWQDSGRRLQQGESNRAALLRQREQLTAALAGQNQALQHNREVWSASEGLEAEKEKLLHRQSQVQEKQEALQTLAGLLKRCETTRLSLETAQAAYRQAQQRSDEIGAAYRAKNKAFLAEQAGILAQSLEEGQPCPVCGSLHHPAPAQASVEAPTEAELQTCKENYEAAQREANEKSLQAGAWKTALDERETQLLTQMKPYVASPSLSHAAAQLAASQTETAQALEALHQELIELEAQIIHRETLGRNIQAQEAKTAQLTAQLEELQRQLTQAEVTQSALQGQRDQLEGTLQRQLAEHLAGCSLEQAPAQITAERQTAANTAAQLERRLQEVKRRLARQQELEHLIPKQEQTLQALEQNIQQIREELARAASRQEEIQGQLTALQAELQYPDAQAAQAALAALRHESKALASALQSAEDAYAACRTELAGTEATIQELGKLLAESGTIDLAAQQIRSEALTQTRTETAQKQRAVHARLTSNETALQNILAKSKSLGQLEANYTWMRALSDTVNGTLSRQEKIALETYVQMACFDRIIQRANVRFMVMSGGQYELKRRTVAENNRSQSGLELDVIDHYNGSERSVKSLSGGESFKASLSLALGLSDEIQSTAGGIRLDTMFVDEGFGSLDEESLQQAIQALTGLTEGNRLVGIISHVSELKERIDKQIIVTKERTGGSHVEIVV